MLELVYCRSTWREESLCCHDCSQLFGCTMYVIRAGITQLVECHPSKVRVASSSLVSRSKDFYVESV